MIHESILGTIGNTPVVRINRLAPQNVTIYVKFEAFNPLSSVKDRLAIAIIEDAERSGALKPGQTVVEATSGNTGIALAMVCAAKGYPFVAIMSDSFSIERRKLMRILGAKVVLTPPPSAAAGWCGGPRSSRRSTAGSWRGSSTTRPIPSTTATRPGRRSSATSRASASTTGSPAGAPAARSPVRARCSRSRGPDQDRRHRARGRGAARGQGVEAAQDPGLDAGLRAGRPRSRRLRRGGVRHRRSRRSRAARDLAAKEGIFCGISSGGTFAAALEGGREGAEGHACILAMLPDTGERYLSTILFEGINEGTDEVPGR